MIDTMSYKIVRQRGFTLLEIMMALTIMGMVIAGSAQLLKLYSDGTRLNVTALQFATFIKASEAYVKDNHAAIAAQATPTKPVLISASALIALRYLPAGFSNVNNYGQSFCALALQPEADKLRTVVASEGGTAINDLDLGQLASLIAAAGGAGGGIYSTDPTVMRGAMGGYSVPIGSYGNANTAGVRCDGTGGAVQFTAGHPVALLDYQDDGSNSAVVYRDSVPGHPELNAMSTPLVMKATVTIGDVCTELGAIAQNGAGRLAACQDLKWKSVSGSWKDPVANFASLPLLENEVGDVRLITDKNRAFAWNGTSWVALAVDDTGNMTIPGTTTTGLLSLTTVVVAGSACPTNGMVARDAAGLTLSCQSGVWKGIGGSGTGMKSIIAPLKGMAIYCVAGGSQFGAYVDGNSNPYIFTGSSWAGGFTYGWGADGDYYQLKTSWSLDGLKGWVNNGPHGVSTCEAQWPL